MVADATVHVDTHRAQRPAQLDQLRGLLADPPTKCSIKAAHMRSFDAPLSIFLGESAKDSASGVGFSSKQAGRASGAVTHEQPFKATVHKERCLVHKPGLDQSWYGAMHDAHLQA